MHFQIYAVDYGFIYQITVRPQFTSFLDYVVGFLIHNIMCGQGGSTPMVLITIMKQVLVAITTFIL